MAQFTSPPAVSVDDDGNFQIAFTLVSRNEKTGPIPVTTTTPVTCPPACPFQGSGCYADAGPLALFWRKVKEKRAGMAWAEAITQIASLPKGTLWRHNQAGDLPGVGNRISGFLMGQLIRANKGKRGFTYTHKPVIGSDAETISNALLVQQANDDGFTVNLSGNNPGHADELAAMEIAPVVTVLPAEMERQSLKGEWTESLAAYRARIGKPTTPAGRPITVCPATYQDKMNCARCGLCAVATRKAIVGFPAHGASKRKASAIAETA